MLSHQDGSLLLPLANLDGVGVALGNVETGLDNLGLNGAALRGGQTVTGDLVLEVALVPGRDVAGTDTAPAGSGADVHTVVPAEAGKGAVGGGEAVAGHTAGARVAVALREVEVGVELEEVAVGSGVGAVEVVELRGDGGRGGGDDGGGDSRGGDGYGLGACAGGGDGARGDVEAGAVGGDDARAEAGEACRGCEGDLDRGGGDGRDGDCNNGGGRDGRDGNGNGGGGDGRDGHGNGGGAGGSSKEAAFIVGVAVGVLGLADAGALGAGGGACHSACGQRGDGLGSLDKHGRGDGLNLEEAGAEGCSLGVLLERGKGDVLDKAEGSLNEVTLLNDGARGGRGEGGGGEESDGGDLGEHFCCLLVC